MSPCAHLIAPRRRPRLLPNANAAALLVCLTLLRPLAPAEAARDNSHTLSDLPILGQATVSAEIGKDGAAYHAVRGEESRPGHPCGEHAYRFANSAQGFEAALTEHGVEVRSGEARWGLSLRRYGYGEELYSVEAGVPITDANRAEYRRGALTEWYVNGPQGLEQGFTLESPPPGQAGGPLTIEVELSGGFYAAGNEDANAIALIGPGRGSAILRYRGLYAYDADRRDLSAWLEVRGSRVLLHVDDTGANYPVVVDPFVQSAKLTPADGVADDLFGYSAAISGDTVVVGAYHDDIGANSNQGSAYVFVKPGGNWANMTQTAKLTASDGVSEDWFGYSVAISGDTVVVGAYQGAIAGAHGSAYVFVRPGGGWTDMTETAKLAASDATIGDALFGYSVAISGNTVVVGALHYDVGANVDQGSAYVFVKPGSGWATMTETAKLTALDGAPSDQLGSSVAISGDTVVASAYGDDSDQGSAYVFVKPGGAWVTMTETAKLTASDRTAGDLFGYSAATSGDAVVVGAINDHIGAIVDQGSAYVFVKPGGGWATMTETAKLTASDGAASDWFGYSAAISGDTVVVGAYLDDIGMATNEGSAYVFVKPGGGWATMTETAKLTANDGDSGDLLGASVAISGDAVVVGANQRWAYVFEGLSPTPTPTPTDTPTSTATNTATPSVTPSETLTGTSTPTSTPTDTPSETPTGTPTPTSTPEFNACGLTPNPMTSCLRPVEMDKAFVLLKTKSPDTGDKLVWRWRKGAQTNLADFGNPLATTKYGICVYDQNGLIVEAQVPASGTCANGNSCWKQTGPISSPTGYVYADSALTNDGTKRLVLRAGASGRSRIIFRANGENLGMPASLNVAQPVTVQLKSSNGVCWAAVYTTQPVVNTSVMFKGRGE